MLFKKYALTDEQLVALHGRGLTDEEIKFYKIAGGSRIQIPNLVIGNN